MRKHFSVPGIAVAMTLFAGPAGAAGMFWGVDDATTLDRGQCHVETWMRRQRSGGPTSLVVAPACTTSTGIELAAFGGFNLSRTKADYGGFQLKTIFHADTVFSWAASFLVEGGTSSGVDAWLLNVPASISLHESTTLHLNVGHLHMGSGSVVWGAGVHQGLGERFALIAERRLVGPSTHESQAGLRWMHRSIALDVAYARGERGNPERRWTLGLVWQF